jgi:fermentation-respiration switch protein FrsA (DUF1100 family)
MMRPARIAMTAVAFALSACGLQDHLLYFPDTSRPDPAASGVAGVEEVALATGDGLTLHAWWLAPRAASPVIVYFHGNGGNIGGRTERLRRFAGEGFGVLLVEYRGYGGNPGRPSEEGLYADARAGFAFLDAAGIASDRLVLYGESLGTGVAVRMASERRIGALVLEAPYTSIADVAAVHYPEFLVALALRDRFDSLSRIGDVQAPLLVLHGEKDEIIPVELGRRLFAAAHEPKEAWSAPRGNHNDLREHGALEVAVGFIRRTLL